MDKPPRFMDKPPRLLIFVSHNGCGIVSPVIEHLRGNFSVVDVIYLQLPRMVIFLLLLASFRPNRKAWYQNWQRLREKTLFSFRMLTRACERHIARHRRNVDVFIQVGAQFSLGRYKQLVPYFVIADSTRHLSSNNKADEISIFRNQNTAHTWLALEGQVYRHATGLIARSVRVGESFVNHYGANRNAVLVRNFGVGLAHSDGNFSKQYDGKTVLFVGKGNFSAKGGQLVLEAFYKVREHIPDARLIIVGQEGKNIDNIEYLGLVSDRNRLRTLFEQAHLFALPSYIERFGMSILEAMAAYTPCIVANHSAMPEIIGDTGFTVPLGDASALAERILVLLQNPDLSAELGRKARARFEKNLSWEAVGNDINMFIRSRIHYYFIHHMEAVNNQSSLHTAGR
ncbi:MAG: glycosyltransferase family 4 protein [Pseudomonadota bacterium]